MQTRVTKDLFAGRIEKEGGHGTVEWALCWVSDEDGFLNSYCNTIPTPEGGTHEQGLRQALLRGLRDHADRINKLARERDEKWLPRYGGQISSEWELAKGLQILEEAPDVYAKMYKFVEAADWIIWQLCGNYVRNACTAGYKGNLQDGLYPSQDYFKALNPAFENFAIEKIAHIKEAHPEDVLKIDVTILDDYLLNS